MGRDMGARADVGKHDQRGNFRARGACSLHRGRRDLTCVVYLFTQGGLALHVMARLDHAVFSGEGGLWERKGHFPGDWTALDSGILGVDSAVKVLGLTRGWTRECLAFLHLVKIDPLVQSFASHSLPLKLSSLNAASLNPCLTINRRGPNGLASDWPILPLSIALCSFSLACHSLHGLHPLNSQGPDHE